MGPSQSLVGNRLLAALSKENYAGLQLDLETVELQPLAVLIEAHRTILHVHFPESGLVSILADSVRGRIEIGMIGREGMVGLAVALGTDYTPHRHMVQGAGRSLRISAKALQKAIALRPSTLQPFALFAQAFLVQVGQTAYANATCTIDARLSRWILMTQDRMQSTSLLLTHEFLSTMLGVRRPGVTDAIHMLERIGAIQSKRGRVIVIDRGKLLIIAKDAYQAVGRECYRVVAVT